MCSCHQQQQPASSKQSESVNFPFGTFVAKETCSREFNSFNDDDDWRGILIKSQTFGWCRKRF